MSGPSLIETLRWEPETGFVRLPLHLARLENSSRQLGLPGAEKAQAALEKSAVGTAPLRVRLELFADGRIEVVTAPFTALPQETIWRVAIASVRLSSTDPLLRHKTSSREIYEAARREFSRDDVDEVLLMNERNELCEGTITSLFLRTRDDRLATPPLSCGLLAGVLRTQLICQKKTAIRKLALSDINEGEFVLGNSLRGLIRCRLVQS